MEGWVSIHRQLSENPLWTCEPFSRGQAWVDLILLASHKKSYFYKRGVKIDVERGSLAWSEKALSERWKWSRSKVRKFLNDLEKEQQIVLQKSNVTQVVTVKNYDKYQQKEPQTVPQKDTKKTPKEPQKDTYNNVNNENNENNIDLPSSFSKTNEDISFKVDFTLEAFKTNEANEAWTKWLQYNIQEHKPISRIRQEEIKKKLKQHATHNGQLFEKLIPPIIDKCISSGWKNIVVTEEMEAKIKNHVREANN